MRRRDLLKAAALAPLFPLLPKWKKETIQLEHAIEPFVPPSQRLITGHIAISFDELLKTIKKLSDNFSLSTRLARNVEAVLDSGKVVYFYTMKLSESQLKAVRDALPHWIWRELPKRLRILDYSRQEYDNYGATFRRHLHIKDVTPDYICAAYLSQYELAVEYWTPERRGEKLILYVHPDKWCMTQYDEYGHAVAILKHEDFLVKGYTLWGKGIAREFIEQNYWKYAKPLVRRIYT